MAFQIPADGEPVPEEYVRLLDEMDRLAQRLDSQYRIPWTNVRFGIDPVVGLIPVVGDIAMAALGLRIINASRTLGADRSVLLVMIVNLTVDTLVGAIPVAGPVFDLFFRANDRNIKLLTDEIKKHRSRPQAIAEQ